MRPPTISTPGAFVFLNVAPRNQKQKHAFLISTRIFVRCASSEATTPAPVPVPPLRFRATKTEVPVGNNGNVLLNILRPNGTKTRSGNVILYLPPGPLFAADIDPETETQTGAKSKSNPKPRLTPQCILSSATLSTVITVNYRLDRDDNNNDDISRKYPTPVHDTLAAFDWVLEHLKPSKLGVFGTHIGGSLAVMLALTEPRTVRAVAAQEPVCDWVGLDDYCQIAPVECETSENGNENVDIPHRKRGRKKKPAPPDLVPLLESRSQLFRKPENYFDAFASPALFLRSSGKTPPKVFPTYLTGPEHPVPILQKPENTTAADDWYAELLADEDPDLDLLPEEVEDNGARASSLSLKTVRRRKVLARWPPFGLDYGLDSYSPDPDAPVAEELVLPPVRIFVPGDDEADEGSLVAKMKETKLEDRTAAENYNGGSSPEEVDDNESSHVRRPRGSIADVAKKTTGETVLARQGAEMVSLMHHACFWGRPLGYGEECVRLVHAPSQDAHWIERQAGEWLREELRDEGKTKGDDGRSSM